MGDHESASRLRLEARAPGGSWLGLLGVLAFSGTFPATRLADPAFGPLVVTLGRAVIGASLALLVLAARGEPLAPPCCRLRLAVVALGVVVGFPLLTSVALTHVGSGHAAVVVGLLPAATAGMAVVRAGERPGPRYWLALAGGLVAVLAFTASQGAGRPSGADLLVLLAVLLGGLGYAEGAVLARRFGGWRVVCWSLVLALPLMAPALVAAAALWPPERVDARALAGLGYVGVVSTLLGFFVWYQGLARGGVARVGRLQLAQPVLTLGWSALLLGEHVGVAAVVTAAVVLLAVWLGRDSNRRADVVSDS